MEINWQEIALSHNKYRRKTIGFGEYDKKSKTWSEGTIYIREVSLMYGGFGAAVWDAAIIFSRWINIHSDIFKGKIIHELGCGVGLPGIMAARYASSVCFSDYLPGVLENVQYNIDLNSNLEYESDEDLNEEEKTQKFNLKQKIKNSTSVMLLDWDHLDPHEKIVPADIIIGSELIYSPKSVVGLVETLEKYLKFDGIFYQILSTDRDGVPLLLDLLEKNGWKILIEDFTEEILAKKIDSKQRPEFYKLYTFKRKIQ